jgi:hypothetical protein
VSSSQAPPPPCPANNPKYEVFWPHILSYLTLYDTMQCKAVSKSWQKNVDSNWKRKRVLDLSQFWASLGVGNADDHERFVAQFVGIRTIKLIFCHLLGDEVFERIMNAVPNKLAVKNINLYYCFRLTDRAVDFIAANFPNMICLNASKCIQLTEASLQRLGKMQHLQTLQIRGLPALSPHSVEYFYSGFPSLTSLNIEEKLVKESLDEVISVLPNLRITASENARGKLIPGGENYIFTPASEVPP